MGDDQQRRELAQARNDADSLIYQTEKMLSEHGSNLPAEERSQIESEIERLKKELDNEDLAAIKSAIESLTKVTHRLSEVMYQAQAQAAASGPGEQGSSAATDDAAAAGGGDDVVDAEFEVEDDQKG